MIIIAVKIAYLILLLVGITMKWINPREKLPEDDQLVWIIGVQNRSEEKMGYPAAEIKIGKAIRNKYGITEVHEINHKGYEYGERYFFNWTYWMDSEDRGSIPYTESLIDAWMPFFDKDLPTWQYIDTYESMEIINKYPSYLKQLEIKKIEKLEEEATKGQKHFIHIRDEMPIIPGVYVAANKEGVWLLKYDSSCNPWIAPNGNPVEAWYPVPEGY